MNSNGLLERRVLVSGAKMPQYYLSVTWRDLNARKAKWEQDRMHGRKRVPVREWPVFSPTNPESGLVALIGAGGKVTATVTSDFLHGIMRHDDQVLSAAHHDIHAHSLDLKESYLFASFPQFNALHSLRQSRNGILVASAGTDAVFEISKDGTKVLWEWWGTEQGFTTDLFGDTRELDIHVDHRDFEYDAWSHALHINSVIELDASSLLATSFVTGQLLLIDRATKSHRVLLDDLQRPHALRMYGDGSISFADTARGRALHGFIDGDQLLITRSAHIKTAWLQDCSILGDSWIMVDGENSRVLLLDTESNVLVEDQFDSDWYLYEAEILG